MVGSFSVKGCFSDICEGKMDYFMLQTYLNQALFLTVLISAVPLVCSMLVGLSLSVIQAATQVQEQSLSFVPKVGSVFAVLYIVGPWLGQQLSRYCSTILENISVVSG